MRLAIGLCLLALVAPVLASNPGEPLDCSDWVFLEPGISCTAVHNCGPKTAPAGFPCSGLGAGAVDPSGQIIGVEKDQSGGGTCNTTPLGRLQIKAFDVEESVPIQLQMEPGQALSDTSPAEQIDLLDSLAETLHAKSAEINARLEELAPQILATQHSSRTLRTPTRTRMPRSKYRAPLPSWISAQDRTPTYS